MSNFWSLSDGKMPEQKSSFDGSLPPIPKGTSVLAICVEAGWKAAYEPSDPDFIQLQWVVQKPSEYKGRKVRQKIHVLDGEDSKSDRAKRMLMAIDTNAGGKLAKLEKEPEDSELMAALMNVPMVLKLEVWESDDGSMSRNWVAAVSPAKKAADVTKSQEPTPNPHSSSTNIADMDDDIQF